MRFRLILLNLIFLVAFCLLGFNLYNLQVENSDYYVEQVQARNNYEEKLHFERGKIFLTDRNNNEIPTAINKEYPIIYAVPKEIDTPEKTAQSISKTLNISEEELANRLDKPDSLFTLLTEKATDKEIRNINKSKPDGVYISKKQYRFYPFKKLASQVLGFVGVNKEHGKPSGLYGVEAQYNEILKKKKDVHLTIDRTLQVEAENILSKLVEEYEASGGSVIIQEPETGKILAMANEPRFDPNKYSEYPIKNFVNPAIQHMYEAGSVFKPITMAIGINSGALTPQTTYHDSGSVTLNGETITNWDYKSHGRVSMTDVIAHSINTGAVYAQEQIGNETFVNYLQKFGFGKKTGIDLPKEADGSLANLLDKNAKEIEFATAAFGQGTAITSIQLVNAYSAIANGGLLMRPYVSNQKEPYVRRRVIEKETARQTAKMMETAVNKAKIARIPGFRVAGKTGTAQIPNFEKGGYSDQYIHTFVGFAPVSDPEFVILLKIDKPNVTLAGRTVVPAFKNLAQFTLNYYQVPPDDLETNRK